MLQEIRQAKILNILHETGSVKIKSLSEQFDVSIVTIRRDLDELAAAGLVTKVYGGAVMPQCYQAGALQILDTSTSSHHREMELIGAAASKLIREGDTVFLDIGETVLEVAKNIRSRNDVTVLTPSVPTLLELSRSDVPVYSLGGRMRNREMAFYGSLAIYALNQFCVDIAFIGCGGVSLEHGITDYSADSSELHAAIAQRARRAVLVTDSSKFGRDSFAIVGPLHTVSTIVTDSNIPREFANAIREQGIQLLIADTDALQHDR